MLSRLRHDPALQTLVYTLSVLAAAVLGLVLWITTIHLDNLQAIQELEPRIARQLGLLQASDQLYKQAAGTDAILQQIALPSHVPENQASTELLQKVRKMFEGAGMSMQGAQALSIIDHPEYQLIPISMTAQGHVASLAQVLKQIRDERPLIHIERLAITPVRTRRNRQQEEQVIRVEMSASVARAKS